MTEHPEHSGHPENSENPEHPAQPAQTENPPTLSRLMSNRLVASVLSDTTKALLLDALGDADDRTASTGRRMYLDSVSVAGFRGIGPKAWLPLTPKPGVTPVVGRNGSGKSSFAEGIETAFTGTSARWDGLSPVWRSNWRNLHDGDAPKVEVRLCVGGDPRPSTLTCTWAGDDVTLPEVEFKRPGHGRGDFAAAGWKQPLVDYRPFLSYSDLDRMISGKPSEMYDTGGGHGAGGIRRPSPMADGGRVGRAGQGNRAGFQQPPDSTSSVRWRRTPVTVVGRTHLGLERCIDRTPPKNREPGGRRRLHPMGTGAPIPVALTALPWCLPS